MIRSFLTTSYVDEAEQRLIKAERAREFVKIRRALGNAY